MSAQSHSAAMIPPAPEQWPALARQAAVEVNGTFGHRLMGLPGLWIGAVSAAPAPAPGTNRGTPFSEWHYWWQAHYLDAILDSGCLALARGDRIGARADLRRAQALLRGILFRNFGVFPNFYFDDMAWLALAATRLNAFSLRLLGQPSKLSGFALRSLTRQLHSAHDNVLGGGLYWSRKRDFKNTPVNGPAALHFARTGHHDTARAIVDWLRTELFNPETGLYIDGVHPTAISPTNPTGRSVEHTVYTYNQGPVLGALLELGEPGDLAQAAALIRAVHSQLAAPGLGIRLEPGADGGLFTGILVRYLALAARDRRLDAPTRETASSLILDTARVVAEQSPQQLSAAIQRWSILSAAASLTA